MKKVTIGIVGLGLVGRSYVRYLCTHGTSFVHNNNTEIVLGEIAIWDEQEILDKGSIAPEFPKVTVYDKAAITLETFVSICDYVLVSAGVAPAKLSLDFPNVFSELDLFSLHTKQPMIAVTGSLGKTTIATLLHKMLNKVAIHWPLGQIKQKKVIHAGVGGNIGLPMLDLLDKLSNMNVLELSSFQLARNKSNRFKPMLAILNNCYKNHLDWHDSFEQYFSHKAKIWQYQDANDMLLLSFDFFQQQKIPSCLTTIKSKLFLVTLSQPTQKELSAIPYNDFNLFYLVDGRYVFTQIHKGTYKEERIIAKIDSLSHVTFQQNILFVLSALFLLGADIKSCIAELGDIRLLANQQHRCEPCLSVKGVDFYNDSKATIIQATDAAVTKLAANQRPLIIILGGLDKGVDRQSFVENLRKQDLVKEIYYFGKQPDLFKDCKAFTSLEEVIDDIFLMMSPGDQVLFSPSGTSFDFFDNYEHRGAFFKSLVSRKAVSLQ